MRRAQRQSWIHWGSLLVLTALLLLSSAVALAAESYPFTTVTNDQVNMRRNASSTSVVLERVSKGDTITVLGEKGNYYKISYKNRTGYVIKRYVTVPDSAVAPTQEPTATGYPYDTVTSDSVNLREKASKNSDRLASIPKGAAVTVHSVSGSFAKVTYNGMDGYCMTDYLVIKTIVKATATPVPAPTLTPEENASGYQVLQKGVSNSHVAALQEALIELGYLSGSADGTFGNATESAVVAFQQKNKYPDTGIVDANLQAFLYSGKPLNAKGQKTSVMTLSPVSGVTIRLNNTGALVRTVQTRLKELGYYAGDVTGTYDKATRSAVLAFQKKNDLKADGLCGAETQAKLLGAFSIGSGSVATIVPAASPTPAPTFIIPTETVRKGSTGDAARAVQQRLKDLGYLTDAVDGKFGAASIAALEKFQTKHGLKADGVAGDDTYAILFSYNALSANALPTPAPTGAPTIAPPVVALTGTPAPITKDNVVLIKLGVKGDAVIRLQQRLTQLGYYNATVDGECKADDVAAIKAFQRLNGLKVDGSAGYDTQVKMYSASAVTYTGAIAGGTVDTFTTLRKGMTGDEVRTMQSRLIQLGYLTGAADGVFGTATSEAVYAFQKANGLVRDGIAGSATLSKLYSATSAAATAAPTETPAPVISTLRKGDANDAVRQMQARLIELGYLSGSADGKFGVQTYRALLAFQRANNLLVDGIAGSKTLTKLNSSNAAGVKGTATPPLTVVTTPAPSTNNGSNYRVTASAVRYANWYSEIRAMAKQYPYATVYDFSTGISWQVHMFSLGAHADSEPLTAADTAKMEKAFGGNTWNPKAVWVVFGDGTIYMASTHSMPHDVQHIRDNNFDGHVCIHFPRTASQVTAIGPYATSHQKAIDAGWSTTQSLIK